MAARKAFAMDDLSHIGDMARTEAPDYLLENFHGKSGNCRTGSKDSCFPLKPGKPKERHSRNKK